MSKFALPPANAPVTTRHDNDHVHTYGVNNNILYCSLAAVCAGHPSPNSKFPIMDELQNIISSTLRTRHHTSTGGNFFKTTRGNYKTDPLYVTTASAFFASGPLYPCPCSQHVITPTLSPQPMTPHAKMLAVPNINSPYPRVHALNRTNHPYFLQIKNIHTATSS